MGSQIMKEKSGELEAYYIDGSTMVSPWDDLLL
jgi:hypothetical protein